jgi:putative membrane protein insertion efficiency factor
MTAWQVTGALVAVVLLLALYDAGRDLVTRRRGRSTLARILLRVIRAYQRWISPVRPPACRFTPTCSAYAVTAVERFGAVRGGWLATRRLLRCGPWHPGGHDPVPQTVGHSGTSPRPGASASSPTGAPPC